MHFFAAKNSMSFALRVFHFSAWGTGKYVRSLVQPLLNFAREFVTDNDEIKVVSHEVLDA